MTNPADSIPENMVREWWRSPTNPSDWRGFLRYEKTNEPKRWYIVQTHDLHYAVINGNGEVMSWLGANGDIGWIVGESLVKSHNASLEG